MDPLTAAGVKGVAGATLSRAPSLGRLALRKWRLAGMVDAAWLVGPDSSGPGVFLNANDAADLDAFLTSDRVRPVLSLLATTLMAAPDDEESILTIKDTLRSEGLRWSLDHANTWPGQFDEIWAGLLDILLDGLPRIDGMEEFKLELEDFTGFVKTGFAVKQEFVDRLVVLASDIAALGAASSAANEIAATVRAGSLPAIISHSDVDEHADFARLYVPRVMSDRRSGEERDTENIVAAGQGFRIVLLGNPGAGKTTFVRHLSWELAQERDTQPCQPAILVRCRDYAAKGWGGSVHEFVTSQVMADFAPRVGHAAVADALILGKFVVIFDGLDEITDVQMRLDFVTRLEYFAANHPLTSILITSREVGYTRAPINGDAFEHLSLREFSDPQIRMYVENWFKLRERYELIEPFLAESETVVDLRRNPLLLSLLCILYRARGGIPRRRRDIYSKCADLLFNTWDSHRQIEQPEELPTYGQRIMQEIARWVYGSPTAQGGLEQRIIEKVIAGYLVGVGVTESEAQLRSREFLEFCAGRAWLLGAFGNNDYGDRIFQFTHRTFYEYFAAEAMSRLAKGADDLANEAIKSYEADATSVLPELLVQAYDERVEHGARDVFKLVAERRAEAGLILRLMNGTLLPVDTRARGFAEVVSQWKRAPDRFDELGFDALFSLEPNALAQFRERFLEVSNKDARDFFARGWAAAVLAGRTHVYSQDVADLAQVVIQRLLADDNFDDDYVLWNWLILRGDLQLPVHNLEPYLLVHDGRATMAGAVWQSLIRALGEGAVEPTDHRVLERFLEWIGQGQRLHVSVCQVLGVELVRRTGRDGPRFLGSKTLDLAIPSHRTVYQCANVVAMALEETHDRPAWLTLRVSEVDGSVDDLAAVREWREDSGEKPGRDVALRAQHVARQMPPWATQWADGKFSLVQQNFSDLDVNFVEKGWPRPGATSPRLRRS